MKIKSKTSANKSGRITPMKCPKCNKEIIGEMQSFCRNCNHTFDSGGDRWFNNEDETIPLSEF